MGWLIAITISLLIAGLIGTTALRESRRKRALSWTRQRLLTAEGSPTPVDVFLALGGTTFALELLVRRELVPANSVSEEKRGQALAEEIRTFGGYGPFLAEMRALLEEFEEESRIVALRRALPPASLPARRVLTGPRGASGLPAAVIDLDARGADSLDVWLDAFLRGSITEQIAGWWQRRHVRSARQQLDEALDQLARIAGLELPPQVRQQRLMARANALRVDAERLEEMRAELNPRALDCGDAVEALLEEAAARRRVEAHSEQEAAERLVTQTLQNGTPLLRQKAGYLLFVNRSLLFPDASPTLQRALALVEERASVLAREMKHSEEAPSRRMH